MNQPILIYVVIALFIGVAFTAWVFQKRRHVDNDGLKKGTAKYPERVKENNPPDAA